MGPGTLGAALDAQEAYTTAKEWAPSAYDAGADDGAGDLNYLISSALRGLSATGYTILCKASSTSCHSARAILLAAVGRGVLAPVMGAFSDIVTRMRCGNTWHVTAVGLVAGPVDDAKRLSQVAPFHRWAE